MVEGGNAVKHYNKGASGEVFYDWSMKQILYCCYRYVWLLTMGVSLSEVSVLKQQVPTSHNLPKVPLDWGKLQVESLKPSQTVNPKPETLNP